MRLYIFTAIVLIISATALAILLLKSSEMPQAEGGTLVVGFYLVANEKLKEDISEDYSEILLGCGNFTGITYVMVDMGDEIIFNRIGPEGVRDLSSEVNGPSLIDKYVLREFISTVFREEKVEDFILILGGESEERNKLFFRDGRYISAEDLGVAFSLAEEESSGFHISLLQIDMCYAVNYDLLVEVAPYCDFILGSEVEISSKGHRYDKELALLNNYREERILTVERIVDSFVSEGRYYHNNVQFSLIDGKEFLNWNEEIIKVLVELENHDIDNGLVIKDNYVDLRLALENVAEESNVTVKERIDGIMGGWRSIVRKDCVLSGVNPRLGGIGYYLP